jgi:hypothetical protein
MTTLTIGTDVHPGNVGSCQIDLQSQGVVDTCLDRTSLIQKDKALISLLFVEGEGRLLGTIRVDGEEFEGAALDRGWPGVEGEEVFLV